VPPYLEVSHDDRTDVFHLDGPRVTVGRGSANDLDLDDPTTSRRHAVLERLAAGWSVKDLGSLNGTYVNGEPVVQPRPLYSGDEIAFGESRVIYHSGEIR
jgi:pSer/pThr/pTyr-binding forkhead associated (FHA) protein